MNISITRMFIVVLPLFKELTQAIRALLTPEPMTLVLEGVVDAKGWMAEQTPALHDHLKAHQFKFERNDAGDC